jgi:hypothetical protein
MCFLRKRIRNFTCVFFHSSTTSKNKTEKMWFFQSAPPDSEVQRRFPPEALQAVFDQNKGDISKLIKPLQYMTKTVESSSSEAQRSLLRELKMSGVVGFASTLLLVYGQKDQAFAWACEVLRLVHLIEENDFADAIEQEDAKRRQEERFYQQRNRGTTNSSRRRENNEMNSNNNDHDDQSQNKSNSPVTSSTSTAFSFASPTISSCVVPLLRAAATRSPESDPTMKKYASLIVAASILGILPDYSADEVFTVHASLALQTLNRIVPFLEPDDAALCAPLAASLILNSSRSQIESLLLTKPFNSANSAFGDESALLDSATQLRLWRDAVKLCLQIFGKASTSVRPRDVSRISKALEHVLRHFFAPGEEVLSRLNPSKHHQMTSATAANSSDATTSINLRVSMGQLIREAAQVVYCAANDGWLPISRSFFDHLIDAATVSLQDPEIIASGAFGACFSCLPRVASVALRGGVIDVNSDIIPRIDKLWDRIDLNLSTSFIFTVDRDAITSIAAGVESWVCEFFSLSPNGEVGTSHLREEFEHRRIVWGSAARSHMLDQRVVKTMLKLFDLCFLFDNDEDDESQMKNREKNFGPAAADNALVLWFPRLWFSGVLFALLRESKKFSEEVSKPKRRKAILKFAQDHATVSCALLLQFWHLLPDDEEEEKDENAPLQLTTNTSTTTDLLRRLYDRCLLVRRDDAPPPFIFQTLELIVASPCPVCEIGVPLAILTQRKELLVDGATSVSSFSIVGSSIAEEDYDHTNHDHANSGGHQPQNFLPLHLANMIFPYPFSSIEALHNISKLLHEASSRLSYHKDWSMVEKACILCLNRPELRSKITEIKPVDLFTLSQVFHKGKGWLWDDKSIATLRSIFDAKQIEVLLRERNDIWARCVLGADLYFTNVAIVRSEDTKDLLQPVERKVQVKLSAKFAVWSLRKLFVARKSKTANKLSYCVLRFLVDFENGKEPGDFDAFSKIVLALPR